MRTASIKRKTKETDIEVAVNLDGTGRVQGFDRDRVFRPYARPAGPAFPHRHHGEGRMATSMSTTTTPPRTSASRWVGPSKQALGSMAGITRYASIHMPMDETLSRVVIDISGRPVLVFKVEFPRDKVGQFDTELVREWFNAFTINAGVTLHVETLYGENSHHIAESCFKGLARALRAAVAIDPQRGG